MKYFRRKVFRLGAVLYSFHAIGIDALKIELIEIRKASGVPLRSFNQKPLVRFFLQSLQQVLRGLTLHKLKRWSHRKGYATKNIESLNFLAAGSSVSGIKVPISCHQGAERWNRSPEYSTLAQTLRTPTSN